MRKAAVFILIISLISACSGKNKIPNDVLPKQKMEDVLWDLLKGGEFLETYLLPRDTNSVKSPEIQEWYDHIFQLHKITRDQFNKSYAWYRNHPVFMKEVLDSLSNKPAQGFRPPGQTTNDSTAIKDSIKKAGDTLHKNPPILPGMHKPGFFNTDSIRRAREKKAKALPVS